MASTSEVVENDIDKTLQQINDDSYNGDNNVAMAEMLLSAIDKHPQLVNKICELLAALGRNGDFRTIACDCHMVASIVPLLSSDQSDCRLQAMRAIGNLCIDHDANREMVLANGGCPYLITQLTRCYDSTNPDSQSDKVKCVTCGCILNLSNENDKLQTEFNDLDVMDGLTSMLLTDSSHSVLKMVLQASNVLMDKCDVSKTQLPRALSRVLSQCCHGDGIMEEALELMESLVNKSDHLKVALVEAGCVDHMLSNLEPSIEPKVNDILVTLLSEDKCLELLFNDSGLLSYALANLNSQSSSHDQLANAALLLANMARTEANCKVLVDKEVVPKLITLTSMEETKEMMGKLHHSALSALRNLSIPTNHKSVLFKEGVVDCALSMLRESTLAHVWFKALGILRLLVDNQAPTCQYITSQAKALERVCEVCGVTGPAQLMLEGSRLLAAIIKYSKSNDVMLAVVRAGGVVWVCSILDSEHAVLSNESLIALNLLVAIDNVEVFSSLCGCDLMAKLTQPLNSPSPEIVSNTLSLLEFIVQSNHDDVITEVKGSEELLTTLTSLTSSSDEQTSSRAVKLNSFITNQ